MWERLLGPQEVLPHENPLLSRLPTRTAASLRASHVCASKAFRLCRTGSSWAPASASGVAGLPPHNLPAVLLLALYRGGRVPSSPALPIARTLTGEPTLLGVGAMSSPASVPWGDSSLPPASCIPLSPALRRAELGRPGARTHRSCWGERSFVHLLFGCNVPYVASVQLC